MAVSFQLSMLIHRASTPAIYGEAGSLGDHPLGGQSLKEIALSAVN
jgi:hypothetical protein